MAQYQVQLEEELVHITEEYSNGYMKKLLFLRALLLNHFLRSQLKIHIAVAQTGEDLLVSVQIQEEAIIQDHNRKMRMMDVFVFY